MACNCRSKNKGFRCFWEIENFAECEYDENLALISQTFDVNMMNKSRWYLKLERQTSGKYFLFLFKNDLPCGFHIIHFSMSILTNNGWTDETVQMSKIYNDFTDIGCYGIPLPDVKSLFSIKSNYLPHGSLTVMCHMWNDAIKYKFDQCFLKSFITKGKLLHYSPKENYYNLGRSTSMLLSNIFRNVRSNRLEVSKRKVQNKETQTDTEKNKNVFNDTEDLLNFFAEKKFSFVTLRTPNKEFAVHKALLCARSPVFCAMFDKDMRENQENVVEIDDIDNDTLAKLLRFLHLELLGNLDWKITTKLYYAADKYQVQLLKSECRTLMKNNITAENVCELLVLSDMHQDEELKQCALDYFCNHSKNILCTEEWKDLLLNKAELACEILRKYAEKL